MIRLFRPELPLAAGICTVTGQVLALGRLPQIQTAVLGFFSVFCISASALILNDLFDYEVDRINAPQRPLPSGMVGPADVIGLTAATTLAGLAAAYGLGVIALVLGVLFWLIGFLYNGWFKQSGLPGNLMVCASVAGTFIFGAVTVGVPFNRIAWIFALMAFFIDLGEEIAGDAMDAEGDKQRGSRSLAILKGRSFALRVSVACWALVILLSFLPVLLGLLGMNYLVFILITDGLLLFFSIKLLKSQDADSGHRAMRGAYLGASLAVLAFLVGLIFG